MNGDELNIKLTLDTSDVDRKIKNTESKLQGVGKNSGASKASKEFDGLAKSLQGVVNKIPGMNKLSGISKTMSDISSSVSAASKGTSGFSSSLSSMIGVTAGAVTALAALAIGLATVADKVSETGAAIDDNSKKLNMTATEYQSWNFVLKMSGSSIEELGGKLNILLNKMNEAKDGTGDAAKVFSDLGIQVTNADGTLRRQSDVFGETVVRLQGISNSAERAAYAQQIFGRSAADLAGLLNMSSQEMHMNMQLCTLLGGVMTEQTVAMSDAYQDMKFALESAFAGLGSTIAQLVLPVITAIVQAVIKAVVVVNSFIRGLFGLGPAASASFGSIDNSVSNVNKTVGKTGVSTGKVANNLGKAAKNAKDLKSYLMGIDELNVIQENSNDDAAGGDLNNISSGVGGGVSGGVSGVDVPTFDSPFSEDFMTDLQEAADKARELGEKLSGLKEVLLIIAGLLVVGLAKGCLEGLGNLITKLTGGKKPTVDLTKAFEDKNDALEAQEKAETADATALSHLAFDVMPSAGLEVATLLAAINALNGESAEGSEAGLKRLETLAGTDAVNALTALQTSFGDTEEETNTMIKEFEEMNASVSSQVSAMQTSVSSSLQTMDKNSATSYNSVSKNGAKVANNLGQAFYNSTQSQKTSLQTSHENVKKATGWDWDLINKYCTAVYNNYNTGFTGADEKVAEVLTSMDGNISSFTSSADMSEFTTTSTENVKNGMQSINGNIAKMCETSSSNIRKWRNSVVGDITDVANAANGTTVSQKSTALPSFKQTLNLTSEKGKAMLNAVKGAFNGTNAGYSIKQNGWAVNPETGKVYTPASQKFNEVTTAPASQTAIDFTAILAGLALGGVGVAALGPAIGAGLSTVGELALSNLEQLVDATMPTATQVAEITPATAEAATQAAEAATQATQAATNIIDLTEFFQQVAVRTGSYIPMPKLPAAASGAVLRSPTTLLAGEYAGAANNPEIVTPEKLLNQIIQENNGALIGAFMAASDSIVGAIQEQDSTIKIGDDVIGRSYDRYNKKRGISINNITFKNVY